MDRDSKGLGIVIKSDDARSSDRLISILTPDRGILKAYAYGARKSIRGIKAALYTEGNFSLYQKGENGPLSLKDIDVISTHEYIYSNLERISIASLFSEIVIKGQDPDALCYGIFVDSIDGLESHNPELVGAVFLLKYLKWAGLSGNWRECPLCSRSYIPDEVLGFSLSEKVAVCSDCDTSGMSNILPMNARLFCARVLELKTKEALFLNISDEQIHRIFRYLVRTLSLVFPTSINTIESGILNWL